MSTDGATMPEPFGFAVRRDLDDGQECWRVDLPHQCDSWAIVGDNYGDALEHAAALAELDRFIAEAQVARAALAERREIDRVPW